MLPKASVFCGKFTDKIFGVFIVASLVFVRQKPPMWYTRNIPYGGLISMTLLLRLAYRLVTLVMKPGAADFGHCRRSCLFPAYMGLSVLSS